MSRCDESFFVRSRGIVVRGMPKRSLTVFQRLVVTSEWLSRLGAFRLRLGIYLALVCAFHGVLVLEVGRG